MDWSRLHPVAITTALEERERYIRRRSAIREAPLAGVSSEPAQPERGTRAATTPGCHPVTRGGARRAVSASPRAIPYPGDPGSI